MIGGFVLADALQLGNTPAHRGPRIFTVVVLLTGMGVARDEVVQRTLAQCTLGGDHLFDSKQVEDGAQNADAAADHRLSVFLQPFEAQVVGIARFHELVHQPVQSGAAHHTGGPPIAREDVGHRTDRARGSVGNGPLGRRKGVQRLVQHGLGGHFSGFEGGQGELTPRKVAG